MSNKYWENEEPIVVKTDKNVFRLYEKADKLQVSSPDWLKDGEAVQGRTVTVDLAALRKSPDAVEMFKQAIGI